MTFNCHLIIFSGLQWAIKNDKAAYADKLRATDNIDDIMNVADNWVSEALRHPRNDGIKQFARGEVKLRVGKNDHIASVIVGTNNNQSMILYDIIDLAPITIKANKKDVTTERRISEVRENVTSNDNVPRNDTSVKDSIRYDKEYCKLKGIVSGRMSSVRILRTY